MSRLLYAGAGCVLLTVASSAAHADPASPARERSTWCGAAAETELSREPGGLGDDRSFSRITPEHLDTEHFRIHYSIDPGGIQTAGLARDGLVIGDRMLVADQGAGVTLVDISHVPSPLLVSTTDIGDDPHRIVGEEDLAAVLGANAITLLRLEADVLVALARVEPPGAPTTIALSGSLLAYGQTSGVTLVDVSVPDAPVSRGSLPITGSTGLAIEGTHLYAVTSAGALVVADVADPAAPVVLGQVALAGEPQDLVVQGDVAIVAMGNAGLTSVDVGNGTAPSIAYSQEFGEFVRRVTVSGNMIYASGGSFIYTAELHDSALFIFGTYFVESVHEILFRDDYALVLTQLGIRAADLWDPQFPRRVDDALPEWPDETMLLRLADVLEAAHAHYLSMGFDEPVDDGTRGGGSDLTDCYIYNLDSADLQGFARPEVPPVPSTDCAGALTGVFGLDRTLIRRFAASFMPDVAAHEVFHVVSYRYGRPARWISESTADWASRQVWADGNGGRYHWCWRLNPEYPPWDRYYACELYGSSHLWSFFDEHTGGGFGPEFWQRFCGVPEVDWFDALTEALESRGTTLDTELATFALWTLATAGRRDGEHFVTRGYSIPRAHAEHTSYPVTAESIGSGFPRPGGASYVRFLGPGQGSTLHVRFNGSPEMAETHAVTLVVTRRTNRHLELPMPIDASGTAEIEVPDWPHYDEAVLVVTCSPTSTLDPEYTYDAWETGAPPEVEVHVANTPATRGATVVFRVAGEPADVSIDVFDAQGRRVRQLVDDTLPAGNHYVDWDGRTGRGPAGAGVYFVAVRIGDERVVERVVLVR